jgi:hypothetical protein
MAVSFKTLTQADKTQSRTILHESIPITGTLVSGTYEEGSDDRGINIKTYSHGMFQSVYDYPYVSSSANHIFDITAGFSTEGSSVSSSATSQVSKKVNIYNQMAQVLSGYDINSVVRRFDTDGDLSGAGGTKHDNAYFLNFSRLLVKDEIKKGSFSLRLGSGATYAAPFNDGEIVITDSTAGYKVNSPAGEYGILKTTSTAASLIITSTGSPSNGQAITLRPADGTGDFVFTLTADGTDATSGGGAASALHFARNGSSTHSLAELKALIEAHPQAKDKFTVGAAPAAGSGNKALTITQKSSGIVGNTTVTSNLSTYSIGDASAGSSGAFINGQDNANVGLLYYQAGVAALTSSIFSPGTQMDAAGSSPEAMMTSKTIDQISDGIRHRIKNISFNNTTELNSSIYFCRANFNEFNYSSNPTYLEGSKIRVKKSSGTGKDEAGNLPTSYVTTVGLYSADGELLAVAKLSEPLRKDPTNELTLRVRLDY